MSRYIYKRTLLTRLVLTLTLNFVYGLALPQGLNSNWLLGNDTEPVPYWSTFNMFFNNNSFTINTVPHSIAQQTTNSNISDSLGNLLFFTNGIVVGNANGDTMQNGGGLNPSYYTSQVQEGLYLPQANLILPLPDNDSIYYLFHSTIDYNVQSSALYLYCSIININAENGLGSVITKNQILISDTLNYGKITAVKHGNGRDWWVFCHKAWSDVFYSILLTPSGVQGPFTQQVGIYRTYDSGGVCFSPDGSKYAYYSPDEDLEIFDFDRCTGLLTSKQFIAINDTAFGVSVAFSPNSKYLYAPSTNYIYQFDVSVPNIAATQTTVASWDSLYSPPPGGPLISLPALFNLSQLAPDGKIYISTGNSTFHLHAIEQPDSAGVACSFVPLAVQLPYYYFNSLPNHPNYFLERLIGGSCDSLTNVTESLDIIQLSIFPNPNNGNFTLNYSLPQNYSGKLEIFDITGKLVHHQILPAWSTVQQISLQTIKAGVYFLKIETNGMDINKKILIVN